MCSRYTLVANEAQLSKRFNVEVTQNYRPRYNAAPTQLLPVITSEDSKGISFFYWGLIPNLSKNNTVSQKLINVKAENISEKASLKKAIKTRRCVIPVTGFFEWKNLNKKSKVPYYIFQKNEDILAMAGLWEEFEDENDETYHTFTIITIPSASVFREFNDRMPLLLNQEAEKLWLDPKNDLEQLLPILQKENAESFDYHSVSPMVNTMTCDQPSVIHPAPPTDQFGNYSLFG
jgi:putative SOS response-associated peptidase YedK